MLKAVTSCCWTVAVHSSGGRWTSPT